MAMAYWWIRGFISLHRKKGAEWRERERRSFFIETMYVYMVYKKN